VAAMDEGKKGKEEEEGNLRVEAERIGEGKITDVGASIALCVCVCVFVSFFFWWGLFVL